MVILGAGGHAKEVLEVLIETIPEKEIAIFDNITAPERISSIFRKFTLLKSEAELTTWFKTIKKDFVIGVGGIYPKNVLYKMAVKCGGTPFTLTANNAVIGQYKTSIGKGAIIMQLAFVSNSVKIGNAALINTRANIHHDVIIGDYSEIAPAAVLLGKVKIGNNTFIGAGSIILPTIVIGHNCTVGAGSVVTKDVDDNKIVKGNPAQ